MALLHVFRRHGRGDALPRLRSTVAETFLTCSCARDFASPTSSFEARSAGSGRSRYEGDGSLFAACDAVRACLHTAAPLASTLRVPFLVTARLTPSSAIARILYGDAFRLGGGSSDRQGSPWRHPHRYRSDGGEVEGEEVPGRPSGCLVARKDCAAGAVQTGWAGWWCIFCTKLKEHASYCL